MYLFKASGATYDRVVRLERHAFPGRPKDIREDEFILLSRNREDCRMLEKQVQFVAKLLRVKPADREEFEQYWPGSQTEHEWRYMAELYWIRRLNTEFHLGEVPGFNAARYAPVQGFKRIEEVDERVLLDYLVSTNEAVLLTFLNEARRPEGT